MTQDEYNAALESGSATVEAPETAASSSSSSATPATTQSSTPAPEASSATDQYIPILVQLQSTQQYLPSAPTFIPQTFQDQIQFVFDGTTYALYFYANNQWNKIISSASSAYFQQAITAHIYAAKGAALIVGSGMSGYLTVNQTNYDNAHNQVFNGTTLNYIGQSFTTDPRTTGFRGVTLRLTPGGPGITWTVNIYATSGGFPTGSSLGAMTYFTSGVGSVVHTFTPVGGPIPLSGNTQYAIVLSTSAPGSSTTNGYGVYLTGGALLHSADGIAWSADASTTLYIQVYEVLTAAGQVQPSDTTQTVYTGDPYDLADNFVGFALATATAGQPVAVNLGPIDSDQSGLTPGAEYYLNGTAGAIATTAGAVSVKVGLALSASSILMKQDNYP